MVFVLFKPVQDTRRNVVGIGPFSLVIALALDLHDLFVFACSQGGVKVKRTVIITLYVFDGKVEVGMWGYGIGYR